MQSRRLGSTDIVASRLGFGAARIARLETPNVAGADVDGATREGAVELVNALLDRGVNFIDTAAGYGDSEEVLGVALAGRRSECWIATKAPNSRANFGPDWSEESVARSIDESLRRLRTDRVDLIQLHSCTSDVLREGGAIRALLKAKDASKTRYIGYSGDGEQALNAIATGAFDVLQTSFNIVDQRALEDVIPAARDAGMGIVAKRPVANAALAWESSPYRYADEYWRRGRLLSPPPGSPSDPIELALRFTLSFDEIDVAIVGTRSLDHALANLEIAEKGPLEGELVAALRDQFARFGGDWRQI